MTIITQKTAFYVGHIEQLPGHFCFESQGCFVFGNDAQRRANKVALQMAEHRLPPYKIYRFANKADVDSISGLMGSRR